MNKKFTGAVCLTVFALSFFSACPVAFADDTAVQDTASSTTPGVATSTPDTTTVVVVPVPDPVTITLDIETSTTLFNKTITVSACPTSEGSATSTVSGYCATQQSGLTNDWSWYGDDAFLNSIESAANDYTSNTYWTWFSNLEMGETALNKHLLVPGETLLLTLGRMPLKISAATTSPEVTGTTTVSVSQFSFDADYNPLWLPAASSTVYIGSQAFAPDATGAVTFTASTTEPLDVYATEDGFLPTSHLTLTPFAVPDASTTLVASTTSDTSDTPAAATTSTGGGGGGPSVTIDHAALALSYLLSQQQSNGSFANVMLSDWAALALASASAPQSSVDTLKLYLQSGVSLSSQTDYERHAMALEALGIDPYQSGVVQHIVSGFDGTQFGDPALVNDDIFALLPLLHAGYGAGDSEISKDVSFILSKQSEEGSWGSVDLTAAAVQALTPLTAIDGVSQSLTKAKAYLATREDANGCFGNSFATSWVLQVLTAPTACLVSYQQPDGGFEQLTAGTENRIWASAYAVPALEGKTWNSLLQNFPKKSENPVASGVNAPATVIVLPDVATTTPALPDTATSTPPVISVVTDAKPETPATALPNIKNAVPAKPAHVALQKVQTQPDNSMFAQAAAVDLAQAGAADARGTKGNFLSSLWTEILSLFESF